MPLTENIEDEAARTFFKILSLFIKVPVYPDQYYYSGPANDKTYGRFSNGPNWSEWVGQMVLGSRISSSESYINRAYGGSWASKLDDQKIEWSLALTHPKEFEDSVVEFINGKLLPPNMHNIIEAFMWEYTTSEGGELVAVFYGANDYINNDYSKPPGKANQRAQPESVVADIKTELDRIARWARAKPENSPTSYIYVANLPRISLSPRYQTGGKKGEGQYIDNDIDEHNLLLKTAVDSLAETYKGEVNFRLVDAHGIFDQIFASSTATYKNSACYPNNMLGSPLLVENINDKVGNKVGSDTQPCSDPENYFFWDVVHPAKEAYAAMAEQICTLIEKEVAISGCFNIHVENKATYPDTALQPLKKGTLVPCSGSMVR